MSLVRICADSPVCVIGRALSEFLRRHPRVGIERHFDLRQVDLVHEGYDLAIGGGFEILALTVVFIFRLRWSPDRAGRHQCVPRCW